MLKSIFSLLDYPKPRKLIMDINIYIATWQGNKLPHVLYITYNQLYHIPGIQKGAS